MIFKTYTGKEYIILDNKTLIRRDDDISRFAVYGPDDPRPDGSSVGDLKRIPKRTRVTVSDVRSDSDKTTYVFAQPLDAPPNTPSGWTKAANLLGGFMNELVGLAPSQWALEPQGANRTVTDRNALVRGGPPDFRPVPGRTIPAGTFVSVLEESGRFVRVCGGEVGDGRFAQGPELGWTAASNLSQGCAEFYTGAAWADQRGPNACWERGVYKGAKVLVNIVGTGGEMEQITLDSLEPYFRLVNEAAGVNLQIGVESGFRTFAKQKELFDGFIARRPGFNLAAEPGRSNHQHGQAFDLNTHGFDGFPIYDWLKQHGPRLGFIRTVSGEHWHWEYLPDEAAQLAARGRFKRDSVDDSR